MQYLSTLTLSPFGQVKFGDLSFLRKGFQHLYDHFIPNPRNNYHPHLLGHRALALLSLFLVVFKVSSIVALLTLTPPLPAYSSAITITNVFNLTNASRTSNNLPSLTQNDLLAVAAANKANALVACACFSHNIGDKTPWSFIKTAGYNYISAGENLAVDFTDAENIEDAWINSPGHRANILNKNYEEIGIGIAKGTFQGHDTTFVVQMFGTPLDQPIAAAEQPTKVEALKPSPVLAEKPVIQTSAKPSAAAVSSPVPVDVATLVSTVKLDQESLASQNPLIVDSNFLATDNNFKLSVKTSSEAVKVVASYGNSAVMLDPKGNNLWEGLAPLSSLVDSKVLTLLAYNLAGTPELQQLADFAPSLQSSYQVLGETNNQVVTVLGKSFSPKEVEGKFYLLFIAGMLSALILAIGLKRHIQHLGLIANGSFVIILAALFWMAG